MINCDNPKNMPMPSEKFFISDIAGISVDPAYKINRDSESRADIKLFIEELYQTYLLYCPDLDFVKKAQSNFNAMIWQMHLTVLLLRNGINVEVAKAEWPDAKIVLPTGYCHIEAVSATNGTGSDAVPEREYGQIVYSREADDNKMLRILNAIDSKIKQYHHWVEKGLVSSNDSFVIAINAGLITDCDLTFGHSYAARCVFGIGETVMSIPIEKPDANVSSFIRPKSAALKVNGSTVASDLFLIKDHEYLSGIIFTPHHIANSFTRNGSDIELILNPFAKNPLPKSLLPFGKVTFYEDDQPGVSYFVNSERIT